MRSLVFALLTLLFPLGADASTIKTVLPEAELRGTATFRYFGFPIYEAQLFTPSGASLDWKEDFGLELKYLRKLTEYDLVEGTMRELNRTGSALPIRGKLEACFRDVRKGDKYLAISKGQNQIGFWFNGQHVCTLKHSKIKFRFMSIFLGESTRSQSFTRKLRGE